MTNDRYGKVLFKPNFFFAFFFIFKSTIRFVCFGHRFLRIINHQFNDKAGIRIVHISIARHAFRANRKKKKIIFARINETPLLYNNEKCAKR